MRAGRATISCPLVTAHMPTFMPATDESTHVPPIGLAKFSRLLRNDLYDKCAGIEAWLLMVIACPAVTHRSRRMANGV